MNSMADKKAAKREKMMNMPSYRLQRLRTEIEGVGYGVECYCRFLSCEMSEMW